MIPIEPDIVAVSVPRHGVLNLRFADGLEGEVDVSEHIWGPVFERVRTVEGFREVYVDPEIGAIVWPGDVDLAPDVLYQRVRTGVWPPELNDPPGRGSAEG
jgi:Protein of unknown function (DUF2442)